MKGPYVIALDQGTTSSRAMLVDREGRIVGMARRTFPQYYPHPGWVEHNPLELLDSQLGALDDLVKMFSLSSDDVVGIGISNQRETTIVWDRKTGLPISNAIVWQCRRTAETIGRLFSDERLANTVREKTGLVPDAYFSASKIAWILDNVTGSRSRAQAGELAFGTVDSWLVWNLTCGQRHVTDETNASRTMLFDIRRLCWDEDLLRLLDVPMSMMPEVRKSSGCFGTVLRPGPLQGVKILGIAGDQQAALFGQCCFEAGEMKCTYGTGCFSLMHTGGFMRQSSHGLLTTVAASSPSDDSPKYALEGSVFMAGALIDWLVNDLQVIDHPSETSVLARSVRNTNGVYLVPAFVGLGAPYWDAQARGAVYGLTRGATRAHFVRAALESIAYQFSDLYQAMCEDGGIRPSTILVDGGVAVNDFLMQFQSDILRATIQRPFIVESSALGAAYLVGLSSGFWENPEHLRRLHRGGRTFDPLMDAASRDERLEGWHDAVRRTLGRSDWKRAQSLASSSL